jgi:hypothetical protein
MTRQTTIKVIKRGHPPGEKIEIGNILKLNDRATRREIATTVEGWIAEFQKSRHTLYMGARRQRE